MEGKELQHMQMKKSLIESLHKRYQELAQFANSIPINQKIRDLAIQNFDQGLMWTREGISLINFDFEEKKSDEQKPEEPCGIESEVIEDKSL